MSDTPKIPYGFKQVQGRSQKGDGLYDGKRFRKVKPEWPLIAPDQIVIRKCEVEQAELLRVRRVMPEEE